MFDPFGNYNLFADDSMIAELTQRLIPCANPRCRKGAVALRAESFYDGLCAECWQDGHRLGVQFNERDLQEKRELIPYEVWQAAHPDLTKFDYQWAVVPGPFGLCPRDDVWESLETTAIKQAKLYIKPTREGYVLDSDAPMQALRNFDGRVGDVRWTVRGFAKLPRRNDGVHGDAGRGEPRDTGRQDRPSQQDTDRCL